MQQCQWRYVYRAIDQFGQVIDVFVSSRDATAARQFFQQAIGATKGDTCGGRHRQGGGLPDRAG
jgi:transposase-like protein